MKILGPEVGFHDMRVAELSKKQYSSCEMGNLGFWFHNHKMSSVHS